MSTSSQPEQTFERVNNIVADLFTVVTIALAGLIAVASLAVTA